MTHLYKISHCFDVDGGFGDPIPQAKTIGIVEADEKEIEAYLEYWDRPRVYENPYGRLYEHRVTAEIVKIQDLSELVPYDERTRLWPDLPEGVYSDEYDEERKCWIDFDGNAIAS